MDKDSALRRFCAPPLSSTKFFVPPESSPNSVPRPASRSPPDDQKDLVTLLGVLSNVLGHTRWINLELVNALDGARLGSGCTFTVRRHRLSRRIHAHNRRLVPGDIVILKVAHGYKDGTYLDARKYGITVSNQMDALIREIRVLTNQRVSDSVEIVDLLNIIWEYEQNILRPVLVIEYAECGTLDDFIRSGRARYLRIKAGLCHNVATGLAVLHQEGIVHGDVKCGNVVVFEERGGLFKAKLIDFGFCIFLMEQDPGVRIEVGGTQPFQAPEVISPLESEALVFTDCFSFGMLVWQVLLDGVHGNELFRHEPFECPARFSSESSWKSYIQAAKEDLGFINNVKNSVSLSLGEADEMEDIVLRLYFEDIFDNTLDLIPTKRNLGQILTWWREEHGPEVKWCLPDCAQHSKPIQPALALDLTQFSHSPAALQTQIFRNLEKISQSKEDKRADEACFLLAQCYFDGIGTAESDEKGIQCLSNVSSTHEAARLALKRMRASNPSIEYRKLVATPDPETYPFQVFDTPLQVLKLLNQNSNLWPSSDESQNSILHWAATFGLSEHLSLFLDIFPGLIEATNEVGETPLICAARQGSKTCVEILVESGARAGHVSYAGETALHWLVSFPDDVIESVGNLLFSFESLSSSSLVEKSYSPSVTIGRTLVPGTPLHRAVALGRTSVVKFLLDRGADFYSSGIVSFDMTALESARRAEDYEKLGARFPIQLACAAHDDQMIELLLRHQSVKLPLWTSQKKIPRGIFASMQVDNEDGLGCPNIESSSLLGYACEPISRFARMCIHGRRQKKSLQRTFEILLSIPGLSLKRVDYKGRSALLTACMAGDTELVVHLLSLPECSSTLETSYMGGWGLKPLHIAAAQNRFVMTEALLNAGANILARRRNGDTALVLCAASLLSDIQVPKLLLSRQPQLASLQTQGDAPFSASVRNHDFNCATLLLEHGADPNQLIGPGAMSTALFQVLAVEYDTTAVKFLLELPNISFIVSPQKRFTALHAPVLGMLIYNYYDEFDEFDGPGAVYDFLLNKWNKKEHLEACEIRGYTALHWAMISVGADVNIMTGFLGSPVWKTALDVIDDRSSVPSIVSNKGPAAVQRYKENTEEMRQTLITHGAKSRIEVGMAAE
ncbi:serine threonine kinase [Fusarium sp. NRRL 52700]|nr:serine threonine kinase [Fusarium sp. NRRL 52700]